MYRSNLLIWLCGSLVWCCTVCAQPTGHFDLSLVPPAPQYELARYWAAQPDHPGSSTMLPKGIIATPDSFKQVDVFYIHPTTYVQGNTWNADVNDPIINQGVDDKPIKFQATAWSGSCRIYAPRYRQAILRSFFADSSDGEPALDLAYQDVRAAFEYYLSHYNSGRPLVIASHSQGTYHARRLMKEYFDDKPLQHKLVCAYLIGFAVPQHSYHSLPICDNPARTGCIISWATFRDGFEPAGIRSFYGDAICVNPISWCSDSTPTAPAAHRGMILRNFNKLMPARVSTRIHQHILWAQVRYPFASHFDNLHIADINLFWMDIREDVQRRIGYFWK
jgi:hypothetical protein